MKKTFCDLCESEIVGADKAKRYKLEYVEERSSLKPSPTNFYAWIDVCSKCDCALCEYVNAVGLAIRDEFKEALRRLVRFRSDSIAVDSPSEPGVERDEGLESAYQRCEDAG